MAKTTTVTTSYTSDIVVNGTTVSADKIYVNGTQVRRCIVNGTDVIHKFTRTVVTASSNLTLTFSVHFNVISIGIGMLQFNSPIYVDVTKVTDNGNSGFTSITLVNPMLAFYCEGGDQTVDNTHFYQQLLPNQSIPLGQRTTLTFSYFNGRYIGVSTSSQYTGYELIFLIDDPDGIESSPYILKHKYPGYTGDYSIVHTIQHKVDNEIVSDNTVQEY